MRPIPFKKHPLTIAVQACCYTILSGAPLAMASPTGGNVVGGTGTISQSGTSTTINQTTQNLAINWQTFDVAANERVQFIQPNSHAVALNRILSNNGSTIAGRIDANGRVILVNANGIFFTPTAVLNVGSIIASGLDISAESFMNNQYVFNEIAGTSGAIVNSGMINASLGGNVALIGKSVKNNGLIVANLGTVTLAAGKQAVLNFDNGGLLGVRVSQEILQSELGVDPAVLNTGEIQAQGGKVLLTASQSQDVFSRAVNTGGMEPATSVVMNDDGTFTLGNGADVVNSGTINVSTFSADQAAGRIVLIGENVTSSGALRADAQSGNGGEIELHARGMTLLTQNSVTSARSESNGNGGVVKVLGDKVGLFDQSKVDVSGANGGGLALIGGDFQGNNAKIRNSSVTIINPGANIYADALTNGNGGKVIAWSDGSTYFLGNIFVRGGSVSGDGGFVETSGKEFLRFDGHVDRTATNGANGWLLLDPKNLTIQASGSNNGDLTDNRRVDFNENGDTSNSTISAATLESELTSGNVILRANNDITFAADVTVTAGTGDLTLEAGRSISLSTNVGITLNGGDFMATINHPSASTGSNSGEPHRSVGRAEFDMAAGSSIVTNGGAISITTGTFGGGGFSRVGNINLQTLNSSGLAGTVASVIPNTGNSGGDAGSITVTTAYGDITVNGQIEARGGDGISGVNAGDRGGNGGSGGNIAIVAARGSITMDATILSHGGAGAAGRDGTGLLIGGNGGDGGDGGSIRLMVGDDLMLNANMETAGGGLGLGGAGAGRGPGRDGTAGAANTITLEGDDSINIFTINNDITLAGQSVAVNGFGDNDRLVRSTTTGTATTNDWTINGENDGNLIYSTRQVDFTDIENLTGDAGQDIFTFTSAGTLSGQVDGGGGITDQVNLSSITGAVDVTINGNRYTNIEDFIGNGTNSTLRGENILNTWDINNTNSGGLNEGTVTFSGFNHLVGSGDTDNFIFSTAGLLNNGGSVNGAGGNNSLTVNATSSISLNSASSTVGEGNFARDGSSTVNYFGIGNIRASGGANINVINTNIAGTMTLANTQVATVTGLVADSLVLNNVSVQAGTVDVPLNTGVNNLTIENSGPVSLSNTGDINLSSVSTANTINIRSTGQITSSGPLLSTAALTLTATGDIALSNANNSLSGPLTFTGYDVALTNNAATSFAGVTANSLAVTSTGDITQTGALNVAQFTSLNAAGRRIELNNPANGLNRLFISDGPEGAAAFVSIQNRGPIPSGFIEADTIILTTAGGIGGTSALRTQTSSLTVNNTELVGSATDNSVSIENSGEATVSITNYGDINLTNVGDLIINRLYTNGGNYLPYTRGLPYPDNVPYVGDVNLTVTGAVTAYVGVGDHTAAEAPDIVAENLTVVLNGGNEFGTRGRFISVRVRERFTYTGGDGFVYYYGPTPTLAGGADGLTSVESLGGLTTQQLLDLDSLDEFDPAIFTEIRNYYYEDVAILLPADQRLDGADDEEEEKEKEGKL